MFDGMVEWPAEIASGYAAKGYWRGVVISDVFDAAVRLYAEREAVVDGERRMTYRELGILVERMALHFAERGICEGRRVVFVLTQVYGMAEGLCCTTLRDDPEEVLIGTQGRPVSEADEFKIVDGELNEVAPGELGELITRGPHTIRGYFKAVEHNRAAFTPDGFYRTGDMVRLHPSGNFIVEGRTKDLINRGGEKISAEEIENLILTHPAVFRTAVVAMPTLLLGERTCAYVVLRSGANLNLGQLCSFLERKRIARFKLPERLEVIEALPTTAVGKISKRDLRDDVTRKLNHERSRLA